MREGKCTGKCAWRRTWGAVVFVQVYVAMNVLITTPSFRYLPPESVARPSSVSRSLGSAGEKLARVDGGGAHELTPAMRQISTCAELLRARLSAAHLCVLQAWRARTCEMRRDGTPLGRNSSSLESCY